jgi:hypothetical protein
MLTLWFACAAPDAAPAPEEPVTRIAIALAPVPAWHAPAREALPPPRRVRPPPAVAKTPIRPYTKVCTVPGVHPSLRHAEVVPAPADPQDPQDLQPCTVTLRLP